MNYKSTTVYVALVTALFSDFIKNVFIFAITPCTEHIYYATLMLKTYTN